MTGIVAELMEMTLEDSATMERRNLSTAKGLQEFKAAKVRIFAELSQHPTYLSTNPEMQADMLAGIEARAMEFFTASDAATPKAGRDQDRPTNRHVPSAPPSQSA